MNFLNNFANFMSREFLVRHLVFAVQALKFCYFSWFSQILAWKSIKKLRIAKIQISLEFVNLKIFYHLKKLVELQAFNFKNFQKNCFFKRLRKNSWKKMFQNFSATKKSIFCKNRFLSHNAWKCNFLAF